MSRARAANMTWWLRILGWLTVYWLAMLVNAAFDVYLQGPMGGILYWSVVGALIAVSIMIKDEAAARAKDPSRRDELDESLVGGVPTGAATRGEAAAGAAAS